MNNRLSFGTDGIRGNASLYPFTPEALFRLGASLGKWVKKKYHGSEQKVLIGSDTRESCERIKKDLIKGLNVFNITLVDAGIIPTPALFQIIKYDQSYNCGIMISASHNPHHDNGIKLFDAQNCKLSEKDEEEITDLFHEATQSDNNHSNYKRPEKLNDPLSIYLKKLITFFPQNFLKGVSVVLDCAHGATYEFAPAVFKYFGAKVFATAINPDGENINNQCGSLYPQLLQKKVCMHNADIGFAFDGDGDRVVAVSNKGIIKDGDDLLALLFESEHYKNEKYLIGTVMTNCSLENHLKRKGVNFIRTPVGDKHVAVSMKQHNALLGGENSGHIIMADYLLVGDGIFVALRLLESILSTKNTSLETPKKLPQYLLNVPVTYKPNLKHAPYADIIKQHVKNLPDGRILVRYSGTENLLRIMVEAPDKKTTITIADQLHKELYTLIERTSL